MLNAEFIAGDCNEKTHNICDVIRDLSRNRRVLSFCFVDPFDVSIKFSTIKTLSNYRVDFLLLLAVYMDAGRNVAAYTEDENPQIDEFLGLSDWRKKMEKKKSAEK